MSVNYEDDFDYHPYEAFQQEFKWGFALDCSGDTTSHTAFSYSACRLYTDANMLDDPECTLYWWDLPPVEIRFDIADIREAVNDYITCYDDTPDGSDVDVRLQAVSALVVWKYAITEMIAKIEAELVARGSLEP